MPSHAHKLSLSGGGSDSASGVVWNTTNIRKWYYSSDMIEPVGGGVSHNNLQPYINTNYIIKS